MRTVKYIFISLFVLLMLLLGTAYCVFYSNTFQNWLTGKLGDYLSAQFKTKISIGHINYKPLQTFELENVLFGDHKNDTLFFAGSLSFNLAGMNLDSTQFKLSNVKIDRGYCQVRFYKDGSFNIDVLDNISDPNDTLPSAGPPFQLTFDHVTCENTRFKFIDETDTSTWEDFAPNHEYFYDISVKANDFRIINDSLHFEVEHLAAKEISGFEAKHIQAVVTIAPSCMLFEDVQVKTPKSYLNGSYAMRYAGWGSFSDFYNEVRLESKVSSSVVDLKEIAFFASPFKGFNYRFKVINGRGSGTVSNMKLRNLDVRFGQSGSFKGRADLNGLPDIDNTFIDAEATQVTVTKSDIEYLAQMPVADEMKNLGAILFKGKYTGFYKDFVAYGHFSTALGTAESDLNMKIADETDDYEYSGNLTLTDFDLGRFIQNNLLGKFSATARVEGKGLSYDQMKAAVTAEIPYFELNRYAYRNIEVNGGLDRKVITAKMFVGDRNLDLDFDGTINMASEIPKYAFRARLGHANLEPLGLDTSGVSVSALADINFSWKDLDHNEGEIDLKEIEVTRNDELYTIDKFYVNSSSTAGQRHINISSDNIEADLAGRFAFNEIPNALLLNLAGLAPEYLDQQQYRTASDQSFTFDIQVKTLYPFNELFFKNIEIRNALGKGEFNQEKHQVVANGYIEALDYNQLQFDGITFKQEQTGVQEAEIMMGLSQLMIRDTVITRDVAIKIDLDKNRAQTHFIVRDTQSLFTANIRNDIYFIADSIKAVFSPSRISYMKSDFRIKGKSEIVYHPSGVQFNDLLITRNKTETIQLNGMYGLKAPHALMAEVHNFHLDVVNELFPYLTIAVNGVLDGSLQLKSVGDQWALSSDAALSSFSLDKDTVGDFKIVTNYLEQQRRLMAYLRSTSGKLRNLECAGYYDFSHPSDALNFSINFDESDITSFQAFVKGYITLYSGSARARGQLNGSLKYPELNCDIDLMGVTLVVDYLRTMYSFSTTVNINEQQIRVAPTEVRDINDHKAMLTGYISHKSFCEPKLNLKLIDMRHFQVLNTKAKDNNLFYGTAYVNGGLSLTGPFSDLIMDATLEAERGTLINIPLSEGYDAGADGLLHFVNRDTLSKADERRRSGSISGFTINCMLHVTKEAEIQIVFDEQQGDKIRGRGTGDLKLELTRSGQFNMYGEVEIDEGDYRFTAMNLFTKKFTLKRGGTITWTGDPFQGQMNITGVYSLRTSVGDIVSSIDREAVAQQRIPVECLLYLRGNLLKPDIKFDMNMYDLNGSLSNSAVSEIQNLLRLWRSENDLMTQQVVSLMLFGRFTPTNIQNATGPTSLSAGVDNTLSGFVSAQATGFIQQLIPGLDVNVDYHTGNESVRGRTILSASKRIFDNRLELQANVDPINTYQNFLTQYNLTRDGNLKAKAFSRAQSDPIFNRNINTQGIGLYYRKEFDKFHELFTRRKSVNNLNN